MNTDPIADMLTRIRNAIHAQKEIVEIPFSQLKMKLAQILQENGYIRALNLIEDGKKKKISLILKYANSKAPSLITLNRISKPGRRVYVGYEDLKPVLGGMGLSVISTSKGLLTDRQAKEMKAGGELLCEIW